MTVDYSRLSFRNVTSGTSASKRTLIYHYGQMTKNQALVKSMVGSLSIQPPYVDDQGFHPMQDSMRTHGRPASTSGCNEGRSEEGEGRKKRKRKKRENLGTTTPCSARRRLNSFASFFAEGRRRLWPSSLPNVTYEQNLGTTPPSNDEATTSSLLLV
ncbi:hypothetical protein GW17_00020676 [Ensete ventricosum]|nr:hypothetical protein GW17_00020676 [Ensete ventricosum]